MWEGLATLLLRNQRYETWRLRMHGRGLWDKNSSLGPGRVPRSYNSTNLQQHQSRPGSRNASPGETISVPSVQFKFKANLPPSPPSPCDWMLPASRQVSRTNRNGYVFTTERVRYTCAEHRLAVPDRGVTSGNQEEEPVQLKEMRQLEHKGRERKRVVSSSTMGEPRNQLISGSLLEVEDGLQPLDTKCDHCGVLFSRLTIAHHVKWCSRQLKENKGKFPQEPVTWRDASAASGKPLGKVVARVVTLGLVPGEYEQVLVHSNEERHLNPRPETRSLPHSSLHDAGFGLPLTSGELGTDSKPSSYEQCKSCGNIVSNDKLGVHHRLCPGSAPVLSTGTVHIPSTHNLLKAGHNLPPAQHRAALPTNHAPSAVVCYICGRKYGSHSIAIHEPQCLKRFNAHNDKLPISERLPLPKKPGSVARVLLREEEVIAVARKPRRVDMHGEMETKDELVQRYLESCYSEFERNLLPCKKCGRTFARARHRFHEPKCNATPLKLL